MAQMIRKQVYILREQEERLKCWARLSGVPEAESQRRELEQALAEAEGQSTAAREA